MFSFTKRDEGFLVMAPDGRSVASVQTTDAVEVNKDEQGRELKESHRVLRPRERNKWEIHFTGYRFTTETLAEFIKDFDALS